MCSRTRRLPDSLVPFSKALSGVLRHRAPELGIRMQSDGYADVNEVLRSLSGGRWWRDTSMTKEEAFRFVAQHSLHSDGCPRFELRMCEMASSPDVAGQRADQGSEKPLTWRVFYDHRYSRMCIIMMPKPAEVRINTMSSISTTTTTTTTTTIAAAFVRTLLICVFNHVAKANVANVASRST